MDNEIAERIAKALERIAEALPPFFEQGEGVLGELYEIRQAVSAMAYGQGQEQGEEPSAE